MFIVALQDEGGEDGGNWDGGLSAIKKSVEKGLANIEKQLEKRMNAVKSQNFEEKSRDL